MPARRDDCCPLRVATVASCGRRGSSGLVAPTLSIPSSRANTWDSGDAQPFARAQSFRSTPACKFDPTARDAHGESTATDICGCRNPSRSRSSTMGTPTACRRPMACLRDRADPYTIAYLEPRTPYSERVPRARELVRRRSSLDQVAIQETTSSGQRWRMVVHGPYRGRAQLPDPLPRSIGGRCRLRCTARRKPRSRRARLLLGRRVRRQPRSAATGLER